jgi:hypothetical protein
MCVTTVIGTKTGNDQGPNEYIRHCLGADAPASTRQTLQGAVETDRFSI